jgi:hypothetical protein
MPLQRLLFGSTATVASLKSRPELNGKEATIRSFNEEKGRYNAEVAGEGLMALKPDNLQQSGTLLPPAEAVEADDYPMSEVLHVLESLDAMEEYHADIAVVCLTKCVEALMEEPDPDDVPPLRVLTSATNAMRTNARNEGAAPQLFGVAILNLPFLLGTRESAKLVDQVEEALGCSLLEMLAQGVAWYKEQAELMSGTMIALRQLLACWVDNDDSIDFVGLDDDRLAAAIASGMLPALSGMLATHPPSANDEGALELHEHAIAAFSAFSGLEPSVERVDSLVSAGAIPHTLRAISAVTPPPPPPPGGGKGQGGKRQGAARQREQSQEEIEAAHELIRAAIALLKAVGSAEAGRAAMRDAGGVATLDCVLLAFPDEPHLHGEVGGLQRRIATTGGADGPAPAVKLTEAERTLLGGAREDVPSFVVARTAKDTSGMEADEEIESEMNKKMMKKKNKGGGGGGRAGGAGGGAAVQRVDIKAAADASHSEPHVEPHSAAGGAAGPGPQSDREAISATYVY